MNKGKVLWFNDSKGWGYIKDDQDRTVFVHYTDIVSDGFKTLAEDQEVTFDLYEESYDKLRARNVKKV